MSSAPPCRPRRTTEAKRGATPLRRQTECPVELLGNRHIGHLQADPSQTNNFGLVHFSTANDFLMQIGLISKPLY